MAAHNDYTTIIEESTADISWEDVTGGELNTPHLPSVSCGCLD